MRKVTDNLQMRWFLEKGWEAWIRVWINGAFTADDLRFGSVSCYVGIRASAA